MAVAGIDVGTTGSKCCVYDENGVFLTEVFVPYQGRADAGTYELDAEQIWEGTRKAVCQVAARISDIRAIAVTSFGESFVLLDEKDGPLTSLMLYSDYRGYEQSLELQREFGAREFGRVEGVKPSQMMSASKLLWVKKNWPKLFARAKRLLFGADYIVYRLCGAFVTDYTLAARTAMFDVHRMDWNDDILRFIGIERERLPRPVPTGRVAGILSPSVAGDLGLQPGVKILAGCHDQTASAIGTGILKPGMAVDCMGTLECITSFYEECPGYEALYKGSYAIVPYVMPGAYITYAFSLTGGALLHWCREQLGKKEKEEAKELGKSFYEYMDGLAPDRPTGLLVLPHFTGAGTPYMDSESRGAIIGLSTETTLAEIYRAMMEGSTFEMRYNLENLEAGGIRVRELRATGGGSQSVQWLQMKADILNIPITTLKDYRAAAIGCAMLAAVALKDFSDLPAAGKIFVRPSESYYPRKEKYEQYNQVYERYQHLYQAVKMVL